MINDWYRVLKEGGVLRISIPSISAIIKAYKSGLGKKMFQSKKMGAKIRTNAEFFNVAFRSFGHKFIYDGDSLKVLLKRAGFKEIEFQGVGVSKFPELNGLEHRIEGENSALKSLCVEAIK